MIHVPNRVREKRNILNFKLMKFINLSNGKVVEIFTYKCIILLQRMSNLKKNNAIFLY